MHAEAMDFDTNHLGVALDDLDREIIHAYWLSPTAGNAAVARQLGVSEATIRRRLRTLLDGDILQFSVVVGPSITAGYMEFHIGLNIRGDLVTQVAEEVASLDRARYVAVTGGGRYDVIVAASAPSTDDWIDFRALVAAIPGVERTETMPIAKVLKRSTTDFTPDDVLGARSEPDPLSAPTSPVAEAGSGSEGSR